MAVKSPPHAPERPGCGGKSLLELIWDELMESYADLVEQGNPVIDNYMDDSVDPERACDYGQDKGRCLGLATAIAIITNPYAPNVDAVREEAKLRYQEVSK